MAEGGTGKYTFTSWFLLPLTCFSSLSLYCRVQGTYTATRDDTTGHVFGTALARKLLPLAAGKADMESVGATVLWLVMWGLGNGVAGALPREGLGWTTPPKARRTRSQARSWRT